MFFGECKVHVGNLALDRVATKSDGVHTCYIPASLAATERVGIRGLRNDVAAIVRRAGGGERIIVTVDGEPVAQLGPLEPTDDLAAAGLVRLPGRSDHPAPPDPFGVPVDVRLASVITALRGGPG